MPAYPHLQVVVQSCDYGTGYSDVVRVIDPDDDFRILTNVVVAAAQLHVTAIAASKGSLTVTATDADPTGRRADLVAYPYLTTDGQNFRAQQGRLIARPCSQSQLAVDVSLRSAAIVGAAVIMRLRNTSRTSCVLEGYPDVTGFYAREQGPVASDTLRSPTAGVRSGPQPPVLLLKPGATASSVVEAHPDPAEAGCRFITGLGIRLPDGQPLPRMETSLPACSLTVDPFVAGTGGVN